MEKRTIFLDDLVTVSWAEMVEIQGKRESLAEKVTEYYSNHDPRFFCSLAEESAISLEELVENLKIRNYILRGKIDGEETEQKNTDLLEVVKDDGSIIYGLFYFILNPRR